MYDHPNVSLAGADRLGYLPVTKTFGPKRDGLALGQRKLVHEPVDAVVEVGPFGRVGGVWTPIGAVGHDFIAAAPPQQIDRLVPANGEQPRPDPAVEPLGRLAAEPQEGVLHGVAGGVFVVEQPSGEPQQPRLVLLERLQHPTPSFDGLHIHPFAPVSWSLYQ